MKTILLVDGENFRKKVKAVFDSENKNGLNLHEYDFKGLFDKVLEGISINRKLFYFARLKEHPDTRKKSKELIEQRRLLKTHLESQEFGVILSGRVRGQIEDGFLGKKILVFKEKGVDVKIAVDMISWACDKQMEQVIIASSDSDLQPAISELKRRDVKCIYLGFEDNPNKGLTYTTDRTILIRNSEVLEFEKTS